MKSPDTARRFLTSSKHLQKLLHNSRNQIRIFNIINQLLPEQLKTHCLGANLHDKQLTLFADSSIWASRLRYESADLLLKVREKQLPATKITVRVQMAPLPKKPAKKKPAMRPVLSENTSKMLKQTADCLDDAALAESLKRLAKHTL